MKRLLALMLVLVMVFALCACGAKEETVPAAETETTAKEETGTADSEKAAEPAGPVEHKLTVGTTSAVATFNWSASKLIGNWMLFEPLFSLDPESGELIPCLAESYEFVDKTTIEIKLREGVKFTNGQGYVSDFTSADVLPSLQARATGTMASRFAAYDWDNCTTPDDYTVVLKLTSEYGPVINYLACCQMYDSEWLASATDEDWWQSCPGTAPYYCSEKASGSHTTFTRKDAADYWGELPECEEVVYRYYAEASTMFIDLETGAIDAASGIGSTDAARLMNGECAANIAYSLNPVKDVLMLVLPEYVKAFEDVRVRQAFIEAIDADAVAAAVYGVLYIEATSTLPSGVDYKIDVDSYEYDPEHAKQLMEEAGYGGGFDLRIVVTPDNVGIAEAIQACVSVIGVNLTIESYDPPTAIPMFIEGETDLMTKVATGGAYVNEPDMVFDGISPLSTLKACAITDPEWVEIFNKGLYTTDTELRAEAYAEAQQWLHDSYRVMPICERASMLAWNSDKIAQFYVAIADVPSVAGVQFVG